MRKAVTVSLLSVWLATPAVGQEVTIGVSSYQTFGIDDLDGTLPPSLELIVSIPVSDRFALEPFVSAGSRQLPHQSRLEGFYGVQVRQRLLRASAAGVDAFVTYGLAGYYWGATIEAPVSGRLGVGLRFRLFRALAVRFETQVVTYYFVPIGTRFVGGASVAW